MEYALRSHITQAEYFILMSIYDALPRSWKKGKERNLQTVKFAFPASSKSQYWEMIRKCAIEPNGKCLCEEFQPVLELAWYDVYILPRKTTLESKVKKIQYKLQNHSEKGLL